MDIVKTIKERRAIRKYRDKALPDSAIQELLDLARHAPSSMNGQPWHFIIVKNLKTKREIAEIKNKYCPPEKQAYKADFLETAPVIILVCVDRQKSHGRELENGILAAANIMLGAHSRGIGCVYMSAYSNNEPRISGEIKEILGMPESVDPIAIIPLGYPDEAPKAKMLPSLQKITHNERF